MSNSRKLNCEDLKKEGLVDPDSICCCGCFLTEKGTCKKEYKFPDTEWGVESCCAIWEDLVYVKEWKKYLDEINA